MIDKKLKCTDCSFDEKKEMVNKEKTKRAMTQFNS